MLLFLKQDVSQNRDLYFAQLLMFYQTLSLGMGMGGNGNKDTGNMGMGVYCCREKWVVMGSGKTSWRWEGIGTVNI